MVNLVEEDDEVGGSLNLDVETREDLNLRRMIYWLDVEDNEVHRTIVKKVDDYEISDQ